MRKLLLAIAGVMCISTSYAQTTDYSLSASGWTNGPAGTTTYTGTQNLQAGPNAWAISPYTGSTMVGLVPTNPTATYNAMTTALGMSADSATALSGEIAAQNPQGGGNITNAAWVYKDFPLAASTKFSMYWVYTSTDYVPFNDGSITSFVNTSGSGLGKINNVLTQYILLGATNPGTGNYSTNSYGSTGWQIVNYEAVDAGTYRLGFASFNQGDTALSPVLYVNDGLGTVTKNGQTFGAVAPNDPNMPTVGPVTPPTPSNPTVVSTTPTDPVIVSTTTFGTPTTAMLVTQASTNTGKSFNVNQTTTPVTATPYTITSVSTPKVIQTWSDNTTTTIDDPSGSATTTTNSGTALSVGSSISQNQSASSTTLNSALKYSKNNPFIPDVLSLKEGAWGVPSYGMVGGNGGKYGVSGVQGGYNYVDGNTVKGYAISATSANSSGFNNASGDFQTIAGSVYALTKYDNMWIKGTIGTQFGQFNTSTSIPTFGLKNTNEVKQSLFYGDLAVYSGNTFYGFRPFAGVTFINSNNYEMTQAGTPLLSTIPNDKSTNNVNPYVGLRYEYGDDVSVEVKSTQTKDYKNVVGVKGTVSKQVANNVKVFATVGHDHGSNYNNTYGMVGVKFSF